MTAIVMVDGIAYTRKEGIPCYDSGKGWEECGPDESHVVGALVDSQDMLATLRAQLAGVREKATPDVVRILRLLSDEKSRPITLHIGYGQQLAAVADVLGTLEAS